MSAVTHPVQSAAAPEAIVVRRADLPLSCPPADAEVWNLHPRVYLPIEDSADGTAACPYCGACYRLYG